MKKTNKIITENVRYMFRHLNLDPTIVRILRRVQACEDGSTVTLSLKLSREDMELLRGLNTN